MAIVILVAYIIAFICFASVTDQSASTDVKRSANKPSTRKASSQSSGPKSTLMENGKGFREFLASHRDDIRLEIQRQKGESTKLRSSDVLKEAGTRWRKLSPASKSSYVTKTSDRKSSDDETQR
jgi:hypothetical protein